MGLDSNSSPPPPAQPPAPSSSSTPSPSAKRARDPDDEVYLDNYHSQKRYLSEIMASSLNGLTVGDPLSDNLMDSQSRSETMFYLRDELSLQYSPMSEDSDGDNLINLCLSHSENLNTSPITSPYRYQRPLAGFSTNPATSSSTGSTVTLASCSQSTRQRGSDSEGRFPSSPSDICHSADLRRAALLRSVQMRSQPLSGQPSALEIPESSVQESGSNERGCSFMKPVAVVDEREYHHQIEEDGFNQEKSCRVLNMNAVKEEGESED